MVSRGKSRQPRLGNKQQQRLLNGEMPVVVDPPLIESVSTIDYSFSLTAATDLAPFHFAPVADNSILNPLSGRGGVLGTSPGLVQGLLRSDFVGTAGQFSLTPSYDYFGELANVFESSHTLGSITFDGTIVTTFNFGAPTPVPEPSTLGLLGAGLLGLGFIRRKRAA